MEVTATEWILRKVLDQAEEGEYSISSDLILQRLLSLRGIHGEENQQQFLNPRLSQLSSPFEMPDMEKAVERIFEAADQGQHVCIYGDYDVDGITSITLMYQILKAYGIEADWFIPHRSNEGYGLSEKALERCFEENGKPDLLITVDCGTASAKEINRLSEEGVGVIVIDHHEPGIHGRPKCVAIVNPKCGEIFTYLCAAGVVFKVAHALLKRRPLESIDLRQFTDLVALATVSDIVPLIDENRILVRYGLRQLMKTNNYGLQALVGLAGLTEPPTSLDVGFRIGPRINAAGRMDHPEDALYTLLASSLDEAKSLAETLDVYNTRRQQYEKEIFQEALDMIESNYDMVSDPVIVVGSRNWHPGVVGIVASRLMRQYYKPTFVISFDSDGVGKGSGRSINGVSLVEAITACREHLITGGGHDMAAGLSISEDSIDQFREQFGVFVQNSTSEDQRRQHLQVDADVEFGLLTLDFLESYEKLQPFGSCNPQPLFMSRNVNLTEAPRRLKNSHLKLFLRQGFVERDAIFFGGGDRTLPDPPWDIAFTVNRNTFRGRTSLQIVIQDVREAQ